MCFNEDCVWRKLRPRCGGSPWLLVVLAADAGPPVAMGSPRTPLLSDWCGMGQGRPWGENWFTFLIPVSLTEVMICLCNCEMCFPFLTKCCIVSTYFLMLLQNAVLLLTNSLLCVRCLPGKRKALKLNFANPPFKSTARFTLNTSGVPFQNPHMWV